MTTNNETTFDEKPKRKKWPEDYQSHATGPRRCPRCHCGHLLPQPCEPGKHFRRVACRHCGHVFTVRGGA